MIWRREPFRSGATSLLEVGGDELRLPAVPRALMGVRDLMTD